MRYFIDTEFIEGFHKPRFEKKRHFIDLISIGIKAEDGREYYAISNEFEPRKADKWVQDNVLYPIMVENGFSRNLCNLHGYLEYSERAIKDVQKHYGKPNSLIAKEIASFVNNGLGDFIYTRTRADCWAKEYYEKEFKYIKDHNTFIPPNIYASGMDSKGYERNAKIIYNQPEFYGYYADYDWVLFCSLFGRMVELPRGFPMYCRDLKQLLDDKAKLKESGIKYAISGKTMFETALHVIKTDDPDYPKQANEHNALNDARWNFELYKFLTSYKQVINQNFSASLLK